MKILPSSPYATFIAKDWNSPKNSSRSSNPNSSVRIKKSHYKNSIKYEIQEDYNFNTKKAETIQLSFA